MAAGLDLGTDDVGEVLAVGDVGLVERHDARAVVQTAVLRQFGLDGVEVRERVAVGLQRRAVQHVDQHRAALDMALAAREGEAAAQSALSGFDDQRGERPIYWNGKKVTDFRDLDDRLPHALEVLMTGGAYLWVDFSRVASVTVEPIERPRDLAYRRAELSLKDGATAPVLLPAIYHGTRDDPALLLGRETQWVEENGITTGRGQRCFLAGDELVSFHDARSFGVEAEGEREKVLNA